jgi:hypothetical protein
MDTKDYSKIAKRIIIDFANRSGVEKSAIEGVIPDLLKAISQQALLNLLDLLTPESKTEVVEALNKGVGVDELRLLADKFTPIEQREAYVGALTKVLGGAKDKLSSRLTTDQLVELDKLVESIDLNF